MIISLMEFLVIKVLKVLLNFSEKTLQNKKNILPLHRF